MVATSDSKLGISQPLVIFNRIGDILFRSGAVHRQSEKLTEN